MTLTQCVTWRLSFKIKENAENWTEFFIFQKNLYRVVVNIGDRSKRRFRSAYTPFCTYPHPMAMCLNCELQLKRFQEGN